MRDEPGDLLDNSVRENVRRIVMRLETSEPLLLEPLAAGTLWIVGACYSRYHLGGYTLSLEKAVEDAR